MNDDRFWAATEHAEGDFVGEADVRSFRRRMRRLGHEDAIIRERVEAIHSDLVEEYDALRR